MQQASQDTAVNVVRDGPVHGDTSIHDDVIHIQAMLANFPRYRAGNLHALLLHERGIPGENKGQIRTVKKTEPEIISATFS